MSDYRHELKYVIPEALIPEIQMTMEQLTRLDPHVGPEGMYNISSVYFDDCYHSCCMDNEDGNDPREKYRIRVYNRSLKRITLEKKYKVNQMTRKRSCTISEDELWQAINGKPIELQQQDERRLLQEFAIDQRSGLIKPIVVVNYSRIPYVHSDGNVRVTLDLDIGGTENFLDPTCSETPLIHILPPGYQLLEVKYDEFLPDEIYRMLNLGHLQNCAFSKFYLCHQVMKGDFFL